MKQLIIFIFFTFNIQADMNTAYEDMWFKIKENNITDILSKLETSYFKEADSTHKRIPLTRIVASKPVSSIKAS